MGEEYHPPGSERNQAASRKQVKLLIVDDQPDHIESLRAHTEMYYSNFALECNFVKTAKAALQELKKWSPSVVLLDAHTRDLKSLEIIERFTLNGVSVIVTSRVRSDEIEESALEYGAAAYLPMSENPDDMEAMIEAIAAASQPAAQNH